jgi:hypothetical protein
VNGHAVVGLNIQALIVTATPDVIMLGRASVVSTSLLPSLPVRLMSMPLSMMMSENWNLADKA